ncbi:MAG: zf-HC2 domain-containing protein [Actinomycetota bacterium]|nr:zf-HC2 domain-containing protein [Actinomycetota bacterium]
MSDGNGQELGREHERLQQLVGAYLLGGLDAEDHRAFSTHLRGCPACQQEAAQFSAIPALLDLVSPSVAGAGSDEGGAGGGPDPGTEELPALLDRVRTARRGRHVRLALAAVVLALAAGGLGYAVGPALERLNAAPTSHLVARATPTSSAAVEIDLVTKGWGTQLDLVGAGLPQSGRLSLWVTTAAGHSYSVASWNGTPSGRTRLTAACWMTTSDIAVVEVRGPDGSPLATASA